MMCIPLLFHMKTDNSEITPQLRSSILKNSVLTLMKYKKPQERCFSTSNKFHHQILEFSGEVQLMSDVLPRHRQPFCILRGWA